MSEQKIKKSWCYDIECYLNLFSATFIHFDSDEERRFIIFHDFRDSNLCINEFNTFVEFMESEVKTLVGYNNHSYDDTIIKHLLLTQDFFRNASPEDITKSCKNLNDKIINNQDKDKKEREVDPYIDNLRHKRMFGSLDLLLLFNTINRVGLKQIAINLRWPEIIDLPYEPSHIVVREEVEEIMYYNSNDVKITKALFIDRQDVIRYRKEYSQEFSTNVINSNDTSIAKTVLRKAYSEVSGRKYDEFKDRRTFRYTMPLAPCISPRIKFISPAFQEALNKFRNTRINTLKIDDDMKEDTGGKKKKKQFEHIIRTKYLTHTLGLGGIHSNNDSELIEESKEYELIDADVASYYPAILINEKLYPEHLGPEFVKVYRDKLFYPRLQAKKEGKKAYQEMLKISLNSTFGLTKSVHSWLYDPHVTLYITVSGQLFLLMLIERLETYTDCVVVYSNTDGVTVRVPKGQKDEFYSICEQWQKYTGFGLEFVNFKRMVVRDVNNFLMDTYDPKKPIKVKGDFVNSFVDRPTSNWITQGYVYPIVSQALQAYYTKGINPEVFIKSSNNIYDFMKAERTSTAKYEITFTPVSNPHAPQYLNKNNRWIVTSGNPSEGKLRKKSIVEYNLKKKNGKMVRVKNKRFGLYTEMQKDKYVTLINDLKGAEMDVINFKLDYNFYIGETYKVIKTIIPRGNKPKQIVQQSLLQL